MLSSVSRLALQNFSTLSHKRHDFRGKKLLNKNSCFYFLYNICLKHFSFREEMSDMWSKMYEYIGLYVTYQLFLSECNETWIFLGEPSFSMRTNGRADRHDEADSRFSQFFEWSYLIQMNKMTKVTCQFGMKSYPYKINPQTSGWGLLETLLIDVSYVIALQLRLFLFTIYSIRCS